MVPTAFCQLIKMQWTCIFLSIIYCSCMSQHRVLLNSVATCIMSNYRLSHWPWVRVSAELATASFYTHSWHRVTNTPWKTENQFSCCILVSSEWLDSSLWIFFSRGRPKLRWRNSIKRNGHWWTAERGENGRRWWHYMKWHKHLYLQLSSQKHKNCFEYNGSAVNQMRTHKPSNTFYST